ncbi:Outer membrane porin F precursor [compost metagenome]
MPSKPAGDPLKGLALDQLGDDIEVVVNESTVSFRISSEILFSSGQADLSLAGLAVLRRLVPVLNSTSHVIAVVGHTDSVPVRSGRYPSNWELSGSRAGGVVRYLEANGVPSNRLRAVAYADTRPLADNATAEGRASNRRVELIMETPGS